MKDGLTLYSCTENDILNWGYFTGQTRWPYYKQVTTTNDDKKSFSNSIKILFFIARWIKQTIFFFKSFSVALQIMIGMVWIHSFFRFLTWVHIEEYNPYLCRYRVKITFTITCKCDLKSNIFMFGCYSQLNYSI